MSLRVSCMPTQFLQEKGYLLGLACARLFASGRPPGFVDVPSERPLGLNFRTEFTMILGPIPAEASSFFGCPGVFDNSIPTSIPEAAVRFLCHRNAAGVSARCWNSERTAARRRGLYHSACKCAAGYCEIDLRRRSQEQRFLRDYPERIPPKRQGPGREAPAEPHSNSASKGVATSACLRSSSENILATSGHRAKSLTRSREQHPSGPPTILNKRKNGC